MKKLIKIIFVLFICLSIKNVYADNYKIKELIPPNVTTSIHTENFSYKMLYFDEKMVHFNGISNLTDKELPVSISIGLFDRKGINIGTINYCGYSLKARSEMSFKIEFSKEYMSNNYDEKDIRYIAILGDNINCRTDGSQDYIGKSIETMGVISNQELDDSTELLLYIMGGLAFLVAIGILYKFFFTKSFRNVDGNEVRKAYESINNDIKLKKEEDMANVIVEPATDPAKPIEILEQEEKAKTEDKTGTDLHNLYK